MKAIIFGINGQDGYYLKRILEDKNIVVSGVSRSNGNWIKGSVADPVFVETLIKETQPDYIFHLAANSTTQHYALTENHETICTGTLNILESVYKLSPKSKVFLSGSAMQFENKGLPINEKTAWSASNPYAVARIQSVYSARYYRTLGLNVYVGYLFHHESSLRKAHHISKLIVDALIRIKNGSDEKIELGNINVKKEWAFAKDICSGIFTLVNQNKVFEACIGTGKTYSIKEWLELSFNHFNLDWKKYLIYKNDFSPEFDCLVSNPATINSLGWQANTTFKELSDIMINNNL